MRKLVVSSALALAAALAPTLVPGQAGAVSVSYITAPITGAFQTPAAAATTGNVAISTTGSITNVQADPWAGTAAANIGTYTVVFANSTASYDLKPTDTISFVWGTPDSWNQLSFYDGATLVDSITGSSIVTQSNVAGAYVTLSTALSFDRVVFASQQNAFEYAFPQEYVTSAVPVPAAGLLAMGGIAALAGLKRRRRA